MTTSTDLLAYGSFKSFKQDEVVFLEGELGFEMYIILKGTISIYINTLDDFPIKVNEVTTGSFFGEMCLIDNQPRSATAIAKQNCSVIAIPKVNFHSFIQANPDMAYRIMKTLSLRTRQLNKDLIAIKLQLMEAMGQKSIGEDDENHIPKKSRELIDNILAFVSANESIFPKGHGEYPESLSDVHHNYLIERTFYCPVCVQSSKVYYPKVNKLTFEKYERDLRTRYVDFDILPYSVVVCPNCNFARFYNDTYQLSEQEKNSLLTKNYFTKGKKFAGYSKPRTYNEVFEAYYIAIYCYHYIPSTPTLTLAKIWMNLAWLYQDCGDEKMYRLAAVTALGKYNEAYHTVKHTLSPREDQQLNLILGNLNLLSNNIEVAGKHFFHIVNMQAPSDLQLYRYAEEELSELIAQGVEISRE